MSDSAGPGVLATLEQVDGRTLRDRGSLARRTPLRGLSPSRATGGDHPDGLETVVAQVTVGSNPTPSAP